MDTKTRAAVLLLTAAIMVTAIINFQSDLTHDRIAQLEPDTEVFYDHPGRGIDLYLVLVNYPDAELILLYNFVPYTDSNPLILRYSQFDRGWIRGYPPEDPR